MKINKIDIVDYLLGAANPIVDFVDKKNGMSPLMYAIKNKNFDIAQMLLIKGASVKLCDFKCMTPLMFACAGGNESLRIVTLLTETYLADVDAQDENGWSPLHYAVYANAPDVIAFLLVRVW